jgi:hypothetical protein
MQSIFNVSSTSEPLPVPAGVGTLPLPPLPAVGGFQFGVMIEYDENNNVVLYIAVADADVTVFAFVMNASHGNVVFVLKQVHDFGGLSSALLPALSISIFQTNYSGSHLCVVLAYSAAPVCSIVVEERCMNESRSTCVANTTAASVSSSSVAAVDSSSGRVYVLVYSMSAVLHGGKNGHSDELDSGDFHTPVASVYGAVISAAADGSWGFVGKEQAGTAGEPVYMYMGDNPHVSVVSLQCSDENCGGSSSAMSSAAFLITHDSGFCPNSETNNKRADSGACDISPSVCSGSSVMNYAYGSLEALQQLLTSKTPLSACHPSIVSITLSRVGAQQAITLYCRCLAHSTTATTPLLHSS